MTKKDIFTIILKLFGLYSVIGVIAQLPSIYLSFYYDSINEDNLIVLVIFALNALLVFILLFKPEIIVNLFQLDRGFDDDEVPLHAFDGKLITKTALIIIALYLMVFNIGPFISEVLYSFKASVQRNDLDTLLNTLHSNSGSYELLLYYGINLLVGFLLITNHARVTNWIEKINKKNLDQ